MPAIYQPLKPPKLLGRLGYVCGRVILENGHAFVAYTLDWIESELRKAMEKKDEDSEPLVSHAEAKDVLAAACSAGMAASIAVIRERVSRLATDLPPHVDMDDWGFEMCKDSGCRLPVLHGRFLKGEKIQPMATFEEAFAFCWQVMEDGLMTTDQAVRLLNQAGELPLDRADLAQRWDALPEEDFKRIVRERTAQFAERLGGMVLLDREDSKGHRLTAIGLGLPPEVARVLGELVREPSDD